MSTIKPKRWLGSPSIAVGERRAEGAQISPVHDYNSPYSLGEVCTEWTPLESSKATEARRALWQEDRAVTKRSAVWEGCCKRASSLPHPLPLLLLSHSRHQHHNWASVWPWGRYLGLHMSLGSRSALWSFRPGVLTSSSEPWLTPPFPCTLHPSDFCFQLCSHSACTPDHLLSSCHFSSLAGYHQPWKMTLTHSFPSSF